MSYRDWERKARKGANMGQSPPNPTAPAKETRITDPTTGGQKGTKVERYDLVPVGPLRSVARHYGVGAEKYEDRNWEKGYSWSLSYAAAQRHLNAFWDGEDIDPENGQPHLAAVVFHAFALMEYGQTHPELDDRPGRDPDIHQVTSAELIAYGDETHHHGYEAGYRAAQQDAELQQNKQPVRQGGYDKGGQATGGYQKDTNSADGPDYAQGWADAMAQGVKDHAPPTPPPTTPQERYIKGRIDGTIPEPTGDERNRADGPAASDFSERPA